MHTSNGGNTNALECYVPGKPPWAAVPLPDVKGIREDDPEKFAKYNPFYQLYMYRVLDVKKSLKDRHFCTLYMYVCIADPKVKFLMEQMEKSGCPISTNFIMAVYCRHRACGFYYPGRGLINEI